MTRLTRPLLVRIRHRLAMAAMSRLAVRMRVLEDLQTEIASSSRVRVAFNTNYFDSLRAALQVAGENKDLRLPDHTFFCTFFQERAIVGTLDFSFTEIERISGRNLTNEIKKLAGSFADVISTVFQFATLEKFAKVGLLRSYEPPPAAGSGSRVEALVDIAGQLALVEAQGKLQDELPTHPDDDEKLIAKLGAKLMGKCGGQLAHADKPTILCQDTDFGVWDRHVDRVLQDLSHDPTCKSASAILFAWTYVGTKWRLWVHPSPRHPLTPSAAKQLADLFVA